ncbi:MAG: type II toxin-antitoxin system Phd/YefM family antitoxin [Gammaproteobacteria bacterium]|nr:type II toxin-antitoxin system Phd/YefM family antitoxin [Gammaproteobacteria bacterium]
MATTLINTTEAKEQFTDLINRVVHSKERILLTRRGKEIAALIPFDDFKHLLEIQDQLDLAEAIDALKEARQSGTVSLEELQTEFG